jgi:hypothetical protein
LDFALWTRRYESSHFPQRIEILHFPESEDGIFVARMERLQCTVAQAGYHPGLRPLSLSTEDVKVLLKVCSEFRFDPIRWSDAVHRELAGRWPLLCSELRALEKTFSTRWKFDLHSKNVMFREDGNLVIVDPILRNLALTAG